MVAGGFDGAVVIEVAFGRLPEGRSAPPASARPWARRAVRYGRGHESAAELRIESVNVFFDEAAELVDLKDEMYDVLKSSYREIAVQVPVRMDDGRARSFSGYRVQHNGARGPVQGRHPLPPDGRPRRGAGAGRR